MSAPGQRPDDGLGERTEEATPRRQEQARERGEVPRSQELSTAVTLAMGLLVLATAGGQVAATQIARFWERTGQGLQRPPETLPDVAARLREALVVFGWAVALPMGAVLVAGLLVNGAQARGVFSTSQLEWKLERLSPLAGLKRLLTWNTVVELCKAFLKFVVLGVALWLAVRTLWPAWFALPDQAPGAILLAMRTGTLRLTIFVVVLFGALAAADYAWQAWQYRKNLRMSLYEVKKELKEEQGDPTLRAWRRRFAQSTLKRIMLQSVKQADVVIANPTHIAVALRVDETIETPVVLAMGTDRLAERIKALAREAGIPIQENRPLARALLETARVGEPIPPALYKAVGDVLAYVYRQTGRVPEWLKRRIKEASRR